MTRRKRKQKQCSLCGSVEHTRPRCHLLAANIPAEDDRLPPSVESPPEPAEESAVDSASATTRNDARREPEPDSSGGDSTEPSAEQQKEALTSVLSVAFGTWSQALIAGGALGEISAQLEKTRALLDVTAAKLCTEVAVSFGWLGDSKWLNLLGAVSVVGASYVYPTVKMLRAQSDADGAH